MRPLSVTLIRMNALWQKAVLSGNASTADLCARAICDGDGAAWAQCVALLKS